MKVLGIETSGLVSSVAIADDHRIICEFSTNYKKTHSVTLMPMLEEMLRLVDIDIKSIDLIAVSEGPGSFTGLRIGSASAKGIAMALNIPIASIPTLDALAYNIEPTDLLICPMMDAKRQQVYTAIYAYEDNEIKPLTETMATSIEDIINKIKGFNKGVIFLGDGFESNKEIILSLLGDTVWKLANSQNRMQRASSIALLGQKYAKESKLQTHIEHAPIYLRKPQAERELEEKNRSKK
jgi:tRNA threonylcarbamoyladenosine biosynthesis protein TsaB